MKTIQIFKILLTITLLTSCGNDDDSNPQDPIDQLPPATQTGENTFGALLDGETFIPSGGINPLDCVYQLVNGERFFTLQGNQQDENFNLIRLSLATNASELSPNVTYQLMSNNPGNVYGAFFLNTDQTFTDGSNYTGELTITRLDLNAQIVSGTFFYDVIDGNGQLRQIREGRFDMRFTQ